MVDGWFFHVWFAFAMRTPQHKNLKITQSQNQQSRKRGAKISIFDIWQSNFSFFFSAMKEYDYCCKSTNNVTWLSSAVAACSLRFALEKVAVNNRLAFWNRIEGEGALPANGKSRLRLLTINIRVLFASPISRLHYLSMDIHNGWKTFFSLFFRPIFLRQFFEQPSYPQKLTGVPSTLPFGGINAAPYGSRREN